MTPCRAAVGVGLALVLAGCRRQDPCNGHLELCGRRYTEVAFPGDHDAYSVSQRGFQFPDQTYRMSRQLKDGIRVLHLEILPYQSDAYLCHGLCGQGQQLLADGLQEVNDFLAANPNEVVTLLVESSGVTTDLVAANFQKSGLVPQLHVQQAGKPWPTLGELIQNGERAVALYVDMTGTGGASFPWLLPRWTWTWETPWNNNNPQDFGRCSVDRGTAGSSLYVVDTYLEDQIVPTPDHAALVNTHPFLIDRLLHCRKVTGVMPNFAMVNYYEVGEVFSAVDVLNGFAPVPPDNIDAFPPATWPSDAGTADAGRPDGGDGG